MTVTEATTCQRDGCTGTYQDFGAGELYCDLCGVAPAVAADGTIGSAPTEVSGAVAGPRGRPGSGERGAGDRGVGGDPPVSSAGRSAGWSGPGWLSAGASRSPGSAGSASGRSGSGRSGSGRSGSGPAPLGGSGSGGSGSARSGSRGSRGSGRPSARWVGAPPHSPGTRPMTIRSSRSATATTSRGQLGAGLVTVPEVPRPDPQSAVLRDPEVPERKRYCGRGDCGAPVGRARGGRPGRTEGFCTQCGHPYSFAPKLRPGDLVHEQYEVVGCLAHGGLGWIYLAVDRAVSDRWVVLKGLLDTGDEDALAAAVAERRFLAEIEHATIVRIYNFVEHLDRETGSLDGYIVMEYVGGKSLKQLANGRRRRDGRRDPLPVEQACAYGLEALDALGHLHSRHLLYCDFKIDNAIQQQNQLKLIDMGAVRRRGDTESPVYGTMGYQAPEVAEHGPSVSSDLYTVARTLAVLTFDFQGYTHVFADSLPAPEHIEVFRRYESFYRLLVRATDPDPERRFASAAEMSEQLTGVLREVVALRTGRPRPSRSTLFGPELRVVDTALVTEDDGEVSLLGSRPNRLPWHRTWRRSARRRPRPGAPAEPTGSPEPAEPAAAPPADPGAPPTVPTPRTPADGNTAASGAAAGDPVAGDAVTGAALAAALRAADATTAAEDEDPAAHPADRAPGPAAGEPGDVPTAPSAERPGDAGTAADPEDVRDAVPAAYADRSEGDGDTGRGPEPEDRVPEIHGDRESGYADRTDRPAADLPPDRQPAPATTVPDLVELPVREIALALPVPQVDPGDPNAGFLAGLMASEPADMLTALRAAPVDSIERRLRALRALLDLDPSPERSAAIELALGELEARYADDWRVVWYRGLSALVNDDRETAALAFDAVYDAFPGEPSAKLALAVCAELLGRLDDATEYYRLVSATDPSYVSATFSLARVRLAAGDRPGAVSALESVPETSIHYTAARVAAVRARLRQRAADEPLLADLHAAADQIEQLDEVHLDPVRRERLSTEVLGRALDWVLAGRPGSPAGSGAGREPPLLGCALDETGLRSGLERCYRLLARLTQTGAERIELVERANRFRPRTWV